MAATQMPTETTTSGPPYTQPLSHQDQQSFRRTFPIQTHIHFDQQLHESHVTSDLATNKPFGDTLTAPNKATFRFISHNVQSLSL